MIADWTDSSCIQSVNFVNVVHNHDHVAYSVPHYV